MSQQSNPPDKDPAPPPVDGTGPSRFIAFNLAPRLVLVRRLFLDAVVALNRADGPSLMQAVMLADLAQETAIKAVCTALGTTIPRNAKLEDVLPKFAPPLKAAAEAHHVRRQRNGVVHEGNQPDQGTAGDVVGAAGDVLQEVIERGGYDFSKFSAVVLVTNPLVRDPLDKAVAAKDIQRAAVFVAIALRRLEGLVQGVLGAAAGADMWVYSNPLWDDCISMTQCGDARHKEVRRLLKTGGAVAMDHGLLTLARLRELLAPLLFPPENWDGKTPPGPIEIGPADVTWAADAVALMAYSFERRNAAFGQPLAATRREHPRQRFLPGYVETQYPPWPDDEGPEDGAATGGEAPLVP